MAFQPVQYNYPKFVNIVQMSVMWTENIFMFLPYSECAVSSSNIFEAVTHNTSTGETVFTLSLESSRLLQQRLSPISKSVTIYI